MTIWDRQSLPVPVGTHDTSSRAAVRPDADADADTHTNAAPGAADASRPPAGAGPAGRWRFPAHAVPPRDSGTRPGCDTYPGSTPGIPGTPSTGDVAPTPAISPGSLNGYAVRVELFDEDKDWIDDEGPSKAVID